MKQKWTALFCMRCRIQQEDNCEKQWNGKITPRICPGYVLMFIGAIILVIMELSK